MLRVLRLKTGQKVYLFDGKGMEALAIILETRKDSARLYIENCAPIDREARGGNYPCFFNTKGRKD